MSNRTSSDCKSFPFVSSMIVFRNEEQFIERCLQSLLEQDYPSDRYEILLIDGESTDKSLSLIENLLEKRCASGHLHPKVTLLSNPKHMLAPGWNIGIRNAKGEYVIRIDAHGYASPDFISSGVCTMLEVGDAVCVGGTIRTECSNPRAQMIAHVLSSPFGVGNSKFRYATEPSYVDTVAFGLYRRSIFYQVGFFDETLRRNQDNDMHNRIHQAGGRFYLNPAIHSTYISRANVKALLKQGFQNGLWNILVFKKDRGTFRMRYLIPLMFVCGILGALLLGLIHPVFWWILLAVLVFHLCLGLFFAFRKTHDPLQILAMPFLFMAFHCSYGIGSLAGVFSLLKN